jgi:hypothetical protein
MSKRTSSCLSFETPSKSKAAKISSQKVQLGEDESVYNTLINIINSLSSKTYDCKKIKKKTLDLAIKIHNSQVVEKNETQQNKSKIVVNYQSSKIEEILFNLRSNNKTKESMIGLCKNHLKKNLKHYFDITSQTNSFTPTNMNEIKKKDFVEIGLKYDNNVYEIGSGIFDQLQENKVILKDFSIEINDQVLNLIEGVEIKENELIIEKEIIKLKKIPDETYLSNEITINHDNNNNQNNLENQNQNISDAPMLKIGNEKFFDVSSLGKYTKEIVKMRMKLLKMKVIS